MTDTDRKIIRKWTKIRTLNPRDVEKSIRGFYKTASESDKKAMMKEFSDYLNAVESGTIKPTLFQMKQPVTEPILKIKKAFEIN